MCSWKRRFLNVVVKMINSKCNSKLLKINVNKYQMIPQENSALMVVHLDNKKHPTRRNETIEHYNYDNQIQQQEALNLVSDLRAQIDSKENEVASLRELLKRDIEVTFPETVEKLRKLQSAFDNVQKNCASNLNPFELEYHRVCSIFEGKKWQMERYNKESNERLKACDRMDNEMNKIFAQLNDPNPNPINETPLYPLYNKDSLCNFDLERGKRELSFETAKGQKHNQLNDSIKRILTESIDRENKAERKHKMALKDIQVRFQVKKESPITPEYLQLLKESEKKKLLLEREKQLVNLLKEDMKKVTNDNRAKVDKLHRLTEEFYDLEKYLPNESDSEMLAKEGSLRARLALLEIERDGLQLEVHIQKKKLSLNQQLWSEIQKKIVEIQNLLTKYQEALQQKQNERNISENNLKQMNEARAELLSEEEFLVAQRNLLKVRLAEHDEKLKKIGKKTEALQLTYRRQMMIKDFNDQKNNLKNCNLPHIANTVESMIKINNGIGDDIIIPSTSSSANQSEPQSSNHSEEPSNIIDDISNPNV